MQNAIGFVTAPKITEHEHEVQNKVAESDKQERLAHEHEHEHEHEHQGVTETAVKLPEFQDAQQEARQAAGVEGQGGK